MVGMTASPNPIPQLSFGTIPSIPVGTSRSTYLYFSYPGGTLPKIKKVHVSASPTMGTLTDLPFSDGGRVQVLPSLQPFVEVTAIAGSAISQVFYLQVEDQAGQRSAILTFTLAGYVPALGPTLEAFPEISGRLYPAATQASDGTTWVAFSFAGSSYTYHGTTIPGSTDGKETWCFLHLDQQNELINYARILGMASLATCGWQSTIQVSPDSAGGVIVTIDNGGYMPGRINPAVDSVILADSTGMKTSPALSEVQPSNRSVMCSLRADATWSWTNATGLNTFVNGVAAGAEAIYACVFGNARWMSAVEVDQLPQFVLYRMVLTTGTLSLNTVSVNYPHFSPAGFVFPAGLAAHGTDVFIALTYSAGQPPSAYGLQLDAANATNASQAFHENNFASTLFHVADLNDAGMSVTGKIDLPLASTAPAMAVDPVTRKLWMTSYEQNPGGSSTQKLVEVLPANIDIFGQFDGEHSFASSPSGLGADPLTISVLSNGDPVIAGKNLGESASTVGVNGSDGTEVLTHHAWVAGFNLAHGAGENPWQTATWGGGYGENAYLTVLPRSTAGGQLIGYAPGNGTSPAMSLSYLPSGDHLTVDSPDTSPLPGVLFIVTFDSLIRINQPPSPTDGNPAAVPSPPVFSLPSPLHEEAGFSFDVSGQSDANQKPPYTLPFGEGETVIEQSGAQALPLTPGTLSATGYTYQVWIDVDPTSFTQIQLQEASFMGGTDVRGNVVLDTAVTDPTRPGFPQPSGGSGTPGTETNPWLIQVGAVATGLDATITVESTVLPSGLPALSTGASGAGGLYVIPVVDQTQIKSELAVMVNGTPVIAGVNGETVRSIHVPMTPSGLGYRISVLQPGQGGEGTMQAHCEVQPDQGYGNWAGVPIKIDLAWKVDGVFSAVTSQSGTLNPIYKPKAPVQVVPPLPNRISIGTGDGTAHATFRATDMDAGDPNHGAFDWYLVDKTTVPSSTDVYTSEGILHPAGTSVAIHDASDPTLVIGTASVAGQGLDAGVAFTPSDPHWVGTAEFDLYFYDGGTGSTGDISLTGNPGWSPPGAVQVEVTKQDHAPAIPLPTASLNLAEDTVLELDFVSSDPADDPTTSHYDFEISVDPRAASGNPGSATWVKVPGTGSSVSIYVPEANPTTNLPDATRGNAVQLVVMPVPGDELRRHVVITPRPVPEHFVGPYAFFIRARNVTGSGSSHPLVSPIYWAVGNVQPVPHHPAPPYPTEMPVTKPLTPVTGVFKFPDVDAGASLQHVKFRHHSQDTWVQTTGTATSDVTVPNLGTFQIKKVGAMKCSVTFTPGTTVTTEPFLGHYSFQLQAMASSPLVAGGTVMDGIVGTVYGAVADQKTFVQLQRIVRPTLAAAPYIEQLCVLSTYSNLSWSESTTGPGGASLSVTAEEIKRKAESIGMSADELIESAAIELLIVVGGEPVFCGPISASTSDSDTLLVSIEALGQEARLQHMVVENPDVREAAPTPVFGTYCQPWEGAVDNPRPAYPADLSYRDVDQALIYADLLNREQQKPGGNFLLTIPVPASTGAARSISFATTDTIAAAFDALQRQLMGAEWWIDANRVLTVAPPRTYAGGFQISIRGTDRRGELVFTERNSPGIAEIGKWDDLGTVALVVGGVNDSVTGNPIVRTSSDEASLLKYGRHVHPISASSLSDGESCAALAADYVQDLADPLRTARITYDANPNRPFGVLDFGVGDLCTIEIATLMGPKRYDCRIVTRQVIAADGQADSFLVTCDLEKLDPNGNPRSARSLHSSDVLGLLYDALFKKA